MLPKKDLRTIRGIFVAKTFWAHGLKHDAFHFAVNGKLDNVWEAVSEPFQIPVLFQFLAVETPRIIDHDFAAV